MEKGSDKSRKLKKSIIIIGSVLLGLLLLGLAGYIAVNALLNEIGRIDPNKDYGSKDPAVVFEQNEPVETDPISGRSDTIDSDDEIVNILLVGQDQRPWETEETQRTDAMILCTINLRDKSVTMTSFLCDLWVYIPDLYNQRLNMPYKLGGFPLLNETLEYNFGIRADYIMEMNFSGFMEAVDVVGGVELELSAEEAAYLNRRGNWGVKTEPKWSLQEGMNLLSGSQTLAYTRINQLGTDFARTGRHQKVLTALLAKMRDLSSADLFDLSRDILPLLSTDMTNNQIIELMLELLPMVSDLKIKTQQIPLNGQYSFEKKGEDDVLVMNRQQLEVNKSMLWKTVSGQ